MYFRSFDDLNESERFKCRHCPYNYLYRSPFPMPPFYPQQSKNTKDMPPSGPPPKVTPKSPKSEPNLKAVDPGSLKPCLYRFVYLWLKNGDEFWAWLTYVGKKSISGWRWKRFRWVYFGVDTKQIESFICY